MPGTTFADRQRDVLLFYAERMVIIRKGKKVLCPVFPATLQYSSVTSGAATAASPE